MVDEVWAEGHEGWAAARLPGGEFGGGRRGRGPDGGWLVEGDRTGQRLVPYAESDGWTARCSCGWFGPSIDRAATRPGEYGGYDAEDAYLPDGRSVDETLSEVWASTHVVPGGQVAEIRAAAVEVNRARVRLDAAVRAARAVASPPSWAEIGKAAGVSRQSAHERWGGESLPPVTARPAPDPDAYAPRVGGTGGAPDDREELEVRRINLVRELAADLVVKAAEDAAAGRRSVTVQSDGSPLNDVEVAELRGVVDDALYALPGHPVAGMFCREDRGGVVLARWTLSPIPEVTAAEQARAVRDAVQAYPRPHWIVEADETA